MGNWKNEGPRKGMAVHKQLERKKAEEGFQMCRPTHIHRQEGLETMD